MAQKKVILQDGSDELLPKTLASMVFTEAGQTVEAALQGAGGGSSGGGTGNVNVTNASGLSKDNYYAFKPSEDGSLTGTFSAIPPASSSTSGLMSATDKNKLDGIEPALPLPSGLKDITGSETDEQVFGVFAAMLTVIDVSISINYPKDKINVGYYSCLIFAMAQSGDRKIQWVLDNNPVSANYDVQLPDTSSGDQYPLKGTASFTYVTSGKLRTVTLTTTLNSSGENPTYDFSAKVEESGDDTYYLPSRINSIEAGATLEEIEEIFGGHDATAALVNLLVMGTIKKLYTNSALYITPITSYNLLGTSLSLFFFNAIGGTLKRIYWSIGGSGYVQVFYPSGYPLNPQLYTLTSSSDTDEISTAVGGESGLKEIIQAVKDGNRLVIRGTQGTLADMNINQDLLCSLYQEKENGDMTLLLSGTGYALWGGTGGIMSIGYTKSSNTFQCQVMTT